MEYWVQKLHFRTVWGCCLLIFFTSTIVCGQQTEPDENRLSGTFYVSPMWVENATGTADEEQVDELQIEYGATIDSRWRSEMSSLALDYRISETKYDEESQPDDSFWEGESALSLGNATTFYEIFAEHSIRRVLRDPGDAPILVANTEERQILTVSPLLRARLSDADELSVRASHSEVTFDEQESNDSEHRGLYLSYTRYVSPMRAFSVIVGEREVDYVASNDADYELRMAAIRLDVEHRYFDYSLELGSTEIRPDIGESVTRPTVDFELNNHIAGNRWSIFANQSISDSSLGNGNDDFFSTEVSFDGILEGQDQIKRISAGISWGYALLCDRCELALAAGLEEQDYINLSVNDAEETFLELGFGYRITRRTSVGLGSRLTDTRFTDSETTRVDAKNWTMRLDFTYAVNRVFDLSALFERDERDSDDVGDYSVNSSRLAVIYHF